MNRSNGPGPEIVRHLTAGETCCDPEWEAAYNRFETAEEEIAKFIKRLKSFGLDRTDKNQQIAELFCGRGGGLVALQRLGFTSLQGVDLSEELLRKYHGPATLHLADCRQLPFDSSSMDAVVVQGGLHHLPSVPDDLDRVLAEVARVLCDDGQFYVVEPWLTPFLRFVHTVVEQPWVRRVYAKGDALAEMIEHERTTYEQWLSQPEAIVELFREHFKIDKLRIAWGKLSMIAGPKR